MVFQQSPLYRIRPPVGYVVNSNPDPTGTQGTGYDYVLADGGLYVQAQNDHITARIRIAEAEVRGLLPVQEKLVIRHGPIPAALLNAGIAWMQQTPETETFFCIRWQAGQYRIEKPRQTGRSTSVVYAPVPDAVVEIHSHASHPAFFSATDDRDEQGLRIYGVAGLLDRSKPQLALRLGVYGYYKHLEGREAFEHFPTP